MFIVEFDPNLNKDYLILSYNYIANALKLHLSCTNLSVSSLPGGDVVQSGDWDMFKVNNIWYDDLSQWNLDLVNVEFIINWH